MHRECSHIFMIVQNGLVQFGLRSYKSVWDRIKVFYTLFQLKKWLKKGYYGNEFLSLDWDCVKSAPDWSIYNYFKARLTYDLYDTTCMIQLV